MSIATLSSAYFAPVQWYQKLYRYDKCEIECYDHFTKQTYRNRCVIATTGGLQSLTVPVENHDGEKCLMRDIRLSDHGNWRHLHWNALLSAYGESPFFEFYADDIHPFFEGKYSFLFDFNMEITLKMCELLGIQPEITATSDYQKGVANDFRDVIRPKHPLQDAGFQPLEYYQVYKQEFGFQPNLSVLDLLFNMGNEAIFYL